MIRIVNNVAVFLVIIVSLGCSANKKNDKSQLQNFQLSECKKKYTEFMKVKDNCDRIKILQSEYRKNGMLCAYDLIEVIERETKVDGSYVAGFPGFYYKDSVDFNNDIIKWKKSLDCK